MSRRALFQEVATRQNLLSPIRSDNYRRIIVPLERCLSWTGSTSDSMSISSILDIVHVGARILGSFIMLLTCEATAIMGYAKPVSGRDNANGGILVYAVLKTSTGRTRRYGSCVVDGLHTRLIVSAVPKIFIASSNKIHFSVSNYTRTKNTRSIWRLWLFRTKGWKAKKDILVERLLVETLYEHGLLLGEPSSL